MNDFLSREASVQLIRTEALAMAEDVTGEPSRDVNYIIPRFVLSELPIGLAGLFIAAIIAAAMSSISSELNSLSTTSIIDFYRRWFRPEATDAHYLTVSKVATAFWGVFACFVAVYAVSLGSLIEVVNRFGSFFYGSILGVFLLAMVPRSQGIGAFLGLLAGDCVFARRGGPRRHGVRCFPAEHIRREAAEVLLVVGLVRSAPRVESRDAATRERVASKPRRPAAAYPPPGCCGGLILREAQRLDHTTGAGNSGWAPAIPRSPATRVSVASPHGNPVDRSTPSTSTRPMPFTFRRTLPRATSPEPRMIA